MKKFFSLILCCLSIYLNAQPLKILDLEEQILFFSFEQADTVAIEKVFRLKLKRKLPVDFEQKILKYSQLQELILQNMHLTKIPEVVFQLKNLRRLNLENNKIEEIPADLKKLQNLEHLILNRNYISSLPQEISQLKNLTYLDLWSNYIVEFPSEISALTETLKLIDMRVISMTDEKKIIIQGLLPKTKFLFSKSCNCKM